MDFYPLDDRKQVRQLRTIQQRHLRFILKIKWDEIVTNDEVLCLAKADDIEFLLNMNRLRWLGHVARDKALLYGELAEGKRNVLCSGRTSYAQIQRVGYEG